MTQQLFDEVIGTPPPSTVDVHAMVRREKRARVARRAGYGLTALVALAVSAGVVASATGREMGDLQRRSQQPDRGRPAQHRADLH